MPTVIPGSGGPAPWPFENPRLPHYFTALNGGVRTDIAMTADVLQCSRIVLAEDVFFTRIGVYVVTAAAGCTIRVGVYRDSDGVPGALAGGANLNAGTTGVKEANTSGLLTAGIYWLAAVAQGGTPTVTTHDPLIGMSAGSAAGIANPPIQNSPYRISITGALPNPFGTIYSRRSHAPLVFLQAGG